MDVKVGPWIKIDRKVWWPLKRGAIKA